MANKALHTVWHVEGLEARPKKLTHKTTLFANWLPHDLNPLT